MTTLTPAQFDTLKSHFTILQKDNKITKQQLYEIICHAGFNPPMESAESGKSVNVTATTATFDFKEALIYIKQHKLLRQDPKENLLISLQAKKITSFAQLMHVIFAKEDEVVRDKMREHWERWKGHFGRDENVEALCDWMLAREEFRM